ncbi:MAG: GNAT family N-acetyltransferase [Bacteroidetes bacterium]|nr:GNAT family N-acetyltransferase [Bacteroidota bacterium]
MNAVNHPSLSVRELQAGDIDAIARYWLGADTAFLHGMGVDLDKMPAEGQWKKMLSSQLRQSYREKQSYCLIWQVDGRAVGHSNVNKIVFGEEAYMHLHLWDTEVRKQGIGTALVKMTLPHFFKNLQLKKLYCEPYALNPAPNRTLEKIGFEFVKEYVTTPGWINFEQSVRLWELSYERFCEMKRI